jgi:hypothetical protein
LKTCKICPVCTHLNSEEESLCLACYADISRVKVSQNHSEEKLPDCHVATKKICPNCEVLNPTHLMLCSGCGTQLAEVRQPQKTKARSSALQLLLFSKEEKILLEFTGNGLVGRCDLCKNNQERTEATCLQGKGPKKFIHCQQFRTVSRDHARIIFKEEKFYLQPMSKTTNITMLNGKALQKGKEYLLKTKDVINLSQGFVLTVMIREITQ